jgi:phosphate transport system substrate-binding protein
MPARFVSAILYGFKREWDAARSELSIRHNAAFGTKVHFLEVVTNVSDYLYEKRGLSFVGRTSVNTCACWSSQIARAAFAVLAAAAPLGTLPQTRVALVATGSSLPEPLYVAWADEYHKQHADVQVRYLPEGTAASSREILSGVGDMGGGDAPNPEKDLKGAKVKILELPSVLIGIVIVYNLPSTPGELRLSGPVLAEIFLGKIKMWNEPGITGLNPQMKLPAQPMQVIHRTDGKGANYILSDFLSKVSPEFLARAGRSESPKWPVGSSAARAQDMSDKIASVPWSIGYTELNIAQRASLRIARVRNASGEFVTPSVKSFAAAASESRMREDFRVSLTNAPGKESYPITSFTWLYVPVQFAEQDRGRAVADYLKWIYSDGQRIAQELGYATLPPALLAKIEAEVSQVH